MRSWDTTSKEISHFVKDYTLMINLFKNRLFQPYLRPDLYKKSQIQDFLDYFGINLANVHITIKKLLYAFFFRIVAVAILAFLGASVAIPFLIPLITMFLIFFSEYILNIIYSEAPKHADKIKNCFLKYFGNIYRVINKVEFQSLDYEQILENANEQNRPSLISNLRIGFEEWPDYFAEQFLGLDSHVWFFSFSESYNHNFQRIYI